MRRLALSFLTLAAVAGVLLFHEARADDTYVTTLRPGADAGTLVLLTTWPAGGNQGMLYCSNFEVRYRLCDSTTACTATSNDSPIAADKPIDICSRTSQRSMGVYRQYDGGVPDCRLYTVNPKTVCPP